MTDKPESISLYQFFQRFPNEEAARQYFERNRWNGEAHCPHCGSLSVVEVKDHKPMPYRCRDCRKHFSVRTGTVLAESRLPLHKWLMAIYMMTTARKGIPSVVAP
jgi:transposase-like protein